jgi:hypothetical protein
MAAFQSGFQLGTAAFGQGQRMALAQEELAMSKERDARAKELHGLNVAALNRTAGREAEQDRITGQIRDYTTGLQRPETNAALDADFNAADQASMQGLKLPAVRGGSNMANQEALAVRKPVDVNSPEYRSGLAGLRQQFALTKGDMADFDRVGEAERKRFTDKDDADYVLDLQKNPTGESASQARSFINAQSKKLSSKVDPKTGMTTFALVKGDGYDEIKVSPADLSKVAVGFRRLQRGDVGGLDVIAGVNKDLAAVAREELKIDVDLGKANNDASYKSGVLDNQGKELDIKRGQAAATAGYYRTLANKANRPQAGDLREFQDDKGNVVMVDITGLKRDKDGRVQMPQGLKPRTTKPQFTPQDYFQALERANNVYGDPVKARMSVDQQFGLTAPTNDVAAQLKALNDKKAGGKPGATPAPAAPAAPRAFEGQRFGMLTPTAMIEEAARAGNKQAIEYLERQRQTRLDRDLYGSDGVEFGLR